MSYVDILFRKPPNSGNASDIISRCRWYRSRITCLMIGAHTHIIKPVQIVAMMQTATTSVQLTVSQIHVHPSNRTSPLPLHLLESLLVY